MRNSTLIGRIAAVAAVAIVVIAVGIIVLSGGSGYQVKAVFQNASQLVNGDQVQVAGTPVGSVSQIQVTPDGQAEMTLTINDSTYTPLRQGTEATVRMTSLTGLANRYVDLRLGPGNAPAIANNGVIGTADTTSAVDLDELFNTLNAPTRKGLQNVFRGSAASVNNQGRAMQAAFQYLNPAIASSSVLFSELNRDTAKFRRFITANSRLVTDLGQRSADLSGLVQNLSVVTEALAAQRQALGTSIQRLPGFMGYADTTFVNLRALINRYLTPLVNVSKPVAPKLNVFLQTLRPLAQDAVPTVYDLARTLCSKAVCTPDSPGSNDLIELTELQPPLASATCGDGPNAASCQGSNFVSNQFEHRSRSAAFPISTQALNESFPELAVARPYAADLTGWFEGFTHPGVIDANGGSSRIASNNVGYTGTGNRKSTPAAGLGDRCPGSMERGAVWYPYSGYPCTPSEGPTGK